MPVRAPDQGRGGAGAVRAADGRGHRLPVRRAVPVRTVRHAGAGRGRLTGTDSGMVTVNLDATLVIALSQREQAAPT
jgi:hypothetical protein